MSYKGRMTLYLKGMFQGSLNSWCTSHPSVKSKRSHDRKPQKAARISTLEHREHPARENEFRDYILGFIFYKYLSERMHLFANEILKKDGIVFDQIDETKIGMPLRNST